MIGAIFLVFGLAFLTWGLVVVGWGPLALIALVAGLIIPLVLRILRWISGCLVGLLPIVLILAVVLTILAIVGYIANQTLDVAENRRPPVLFIAATICFVAFGLFISGLTKPTE